MDKKHELTVGNLSDKNTTIRELIETGLLGLAAVSSGLVVTFADGEIVKLVAGYALGGSSIAFGYFLQDLIESLKNKEEQVLPHIAEPENKKRNVLWTQKSLKKLEGLKKTDPKAYDELISANEFGLFGK